VESQGGTWVFQHFVFENSSMMGVGLVVKQKKQQNLEMNQQDPYCFWLSTSMNRNIKSVSVTVKLNFKPGHQISEMSQNVLSSSQC